MPLSLMCRRCGSEVHHEDSFCQECGLANAFERNGTSATSSDLSSQKYSTSSSRSTGNASWPALDPDPVPAEWSALKAHKQRAAFVATQLDASAVEQLTALGADDTDFDWPALDMDPSQIADDSFDATPPVKNIEPQTYAFASYQLDLKPYCNETSSGNSHSQTAAQNQNEHHNAAATRLHSPIFDSDEEIAADNFAASAFERHIDNGLGMRGGWAMVAIDIAVLAAVVCFVSALGVWAYSNFQKQEFARAKSQSQSLAMSLKIASTKQDYQTLYSTLILTKASNKDKQLDERQQALLDESAYELGQKELAAGHESTAMEYFKQVSIESDHYVSAQQILFNSLAPSYQAPAATTTLNDQSDESKRNALRRRRNNQLQSSSFAPRIISDKPVLSIPVIPEIEKAKNHDNAQSQDTAAGAASPAIEEPPVQKFSESEISRYNRQLAAYFSKHNVGNDTAGGSGEPPSFKEWLRQGKPVF